MLIKKKVSSVFQFLATLATLAVIVALGSTNPAAAEGVTSWDDLVAKADTFTSGSHDLTITGNLTVGEQSKPLVVPAGAELTLKGKGSTVTGKNKTAVEVKSGGKLNLEGPNFTETQFTVNGDLNFSAGSIHDSAPAGPVIFVNGGTFTMSGTADFSKNTMPEGKVANAVTPEGVDAKKLAPITVYNGTATISGGTIKGNQGLQKGGALGVWGIAEKSATLNVKGGEIAENSVQHSRLYGFGGAIFGEKTNVNISGGNIHHNFTERGGALYAANSTLTVSDVNLHDNQASREYQGQGGALFLSGSKTLISGGTFKNNTALGDGYSFQEDGPGGAIYANGGNITINGGSFTGNTAGSSGGAIAFGGKAEATINAAYFSENKSEGFYGGGAIYNDISTKLTINNALIRNNSFKKLILIGAGNHRPSVQGGGIWNCPTGQTHLNITKGAAIFNNRTADVEENKEYKGAGDDFASVTEHYDGKIGAGQPVSISPRMLGGGQRLWYQDGSIYGKHLDWDPPQEPRYKEGGENKLMPYDQEINENKAYKSVPSEDSKKLAEKLARVIIENNTATGAGIVGGGIANNGELFFGNPDRWKLQVNKAWQGDDPAQRPTKITLDVLVGGYKVDQVELSKEKNWTATVENFPDPDTLIDAKTGKKLPITFREHDGNGKQLDGYQLAVTGESKDEDTKTYNISVVNKMPTKVEVVKKWANPDGTCPDASQIEVKLLTNGKATDKKLTLNAANSWKGKFEDLPKYIDGKIAEYTVSEVEIKGYRSEVSGDATKGFTVTNTCTVPPPGHTPPPPKKTPPLPRTGSGISAALALGILALAAGAVLVRRRLQNG
ncbi:MAG: Cna B-type domain-containing protein [Varibaculum cambriense]|uniref:Cna B-type domain-containing protein n=1 Tax=Varibaculum cambriense TaxID=184870 RepID=UPI00290EE964|nr:Cna B-type domain-containing protein [Varibaculum cambriense]MDU6681485.1 Cna B-type domain-containing protein [Varibaculum cambriense]